MTRGRAKLSVSHSSWVIHPTRCPWCPPRGVPCASRRRESARIAAYSLHPSRWPFPLAIAPSLPRFVNSAHSVRWLGDIHTHMEPSGKRVVFAHAHESLQRQPTWTDSRARVNPSDFHDAHQLHAALENAQRKVELLERELQLMGTGGGALHQQFQSSWSGGADPTLTRPYAPSHSDSPPLQAPPDRCNAQLKSTFLLPEMFGSAEFNDQGQVRHIRHALTSRACSGARRLSPACSSARLPAAVQTQTRLPR